MHIILMLLGAISALGIVLWRISIAIQAAREISDAAQGVANLPRRMRFRSRASREGVANINDPREAATFLMLAVARAAGEVTAGQKGAMRAQIARRFELSEKRADEMLTHVAWMTRDLPSPESGVDRMVRLLVERVTQLELAELATMLDAVACADGDVAGDQAAIARQVLAQLPR